jgi:ABC-type Fe3+-siderophore transport system permease subunit
MALVGVAVATVGAVGFVGLMAPHAARLQWLLRRRA